ncbi:MAG TPA: MHYT domain-containing protein [Pseudonocardiaceae bacterium]|nr:MHYT domain-containing protein [Pseudonocardiaceae bacterium]
MAEFSLGTWTPIIAYLVSSCGAALALLCTERARIITGPARSGWLILGAVSLGGTGIWVMHFTAMLGMTMTGTAIGYNVPITLVSMLVAVVVAGIGLFVANRGGAKVRPLLVGGLFTGVGVAGMHYVGIAAMEVQGDVHFNLAIVALSVVIAVVAATAALWATVTVRGPRAIAAAAAVMGLAVTGMHYTGIAAMSVTLDPAKPVSAGISASVLIPLVIMGVAVVSVLTVFVLALSPGARELREDDALRDWASQQAP